MAAPLNALELLQNYRQRDQMEAMRAQQMETAAMMRPLQMEGLQQNMLAKRMAMEDDRAKKNALAEFGQTGNLNSLMTADPKTGIALKASNERNALMRDQLASRERIAAQRGAAGPKAPAGYRFKEDGSLEPIPGGPAIKPDKLSAGVQTKVDEAQDVLGLAADAEKLLGTATGSYLGAGVDQGARLFGVSTPGAQAASQLKVLEGSLISKMPKMSGPQSDKDVLLYKQMAGQIGDPTIPEEQKRAALSTIRDINARYLKDQGVEPRSPTTAGPQVGMVKSGYRFKGGDPADKANWEKQ